MNLKNCPAEMKLCPEKSAHMISRDLESHVLELSAYAAFFAFLLSLAVMRKRALESRLRESKTRRTLKLVYLRRAQTIVNIITIIRPNAQERGQHPKKIPFRRVGFQIVY